MTLILLLLGYAVLVTAIAPLLLSRGTWQVRHPRAALAAWHLVLTTAVLAVVISTGHAMAVALSGGSATSSDREVLAVWVFAWMSLAAGGAVSALLLSSVPRVLAASDAEQGAVTDLVLRSAYDTRRDGKVAVRMLDSPVPFAGAIRMPEPTIIITRALREELTEAQLAAVKEHERTHLAQRHDLVAAATSVVASCLPRSRRRRNLQESTALLIELIADDAAARRCGPAHLANALARTAELTADPALELRAQRLAARRWRPLRRRPVRRYAPSPA